MEASVVPGNVLQGHVLCYISKGTYKCSSATSSFGNYFEGCHQCSELADGKGNRLLFPKVEIHLITQISNGIIAGRDKVSLTEKVATYCRSLAFRRHP